jgi:hypothetical protein
VIKHPICYSLEPAKIDKGSHWIRLNLKNIGSETIVNLDIKLLSEDTFNLNVITPYKWLTRLDPGEETSIPFQVHARRDTDIYFSINGLKGQEYFHWESPSVKLKVGLEAAQIDSLFIIEKPYTELEEKLIVEAVVKGNKNCEELELEFLADIPAGGFEELGRIQINKLGADECEKYSVEFMPYNTGLYIAHAHLFYLNRIIDRESDRTVIR